MTTADVTSTDSGAAELHDLQGQHLLAVAAVIDSEHPLQWLASMTPSEGGLAGRDFEVELQSLSLDPQSTTSPRMLVGEPIYFSIHLDTQSELTVSLPEVFVIGSANPITGSDISGSFDFAGGAIGDDLWCGAVSGMVTQPLMLDLAGSTFAATRVDGIDDLPESVVAACP